MTPRFIQTALLLSTATLLGCSKSSPALSSKSTGEDTTIAMFALGFTNLYKVTPTALYVNPELASLCVGVSKEQVDAASIKFGPHANAAVLIYMNDLAAAAFAMNGNRYPVGAVIVKQKLLLSYHDKDGKQVQPTNGVGGMIKRSPGYDPKHGDWEYFYFEDTSKIESGSISSCVQCHDGAKGNDYVFGTWSAKQGG